MGNLNQFYLMGRVASPPRASEDGSQVTLAVSPGTGHRAPRSAPPLTLIALGPQLEAAKALEKGQAVLLRGQLRQEESGLTARVQAIELLADGAPAGSSGPAKRRKRRRRKGSGEKREGDKSEGDKSESGGEGGEAPQPAPPAKDPKANLPPPKPVADVSPQSAPPPDASSDMPF